MKKSTEERKAEGKEKTGVFTGAYAINELTGYRMPIWVSDFVLKEFGTGAVVGVPGHDTRDFDFAKKFDLEISPHDAEYPARCAAQRFDQTGVRSAAVRRAGADQPRNRRIDQAGEEHGEDLSPVSAA